MRTIQLAGLSVLLAAGSALAQNAGPPGGNGAQTARGVIESFNGSVLTIKAEDGTMTSATLAPNGTITSNEKATLADIKPGDFVATGGTLGADGKIHSNEIRIFPEAMRGRGEGQFPMQQPGQIMTNATIEQVVSVSGGGVMKMTFHGTKDANGQCTGRAPADLSTACVGETEIQVAPDIPVTAQRSVEASALKPGMHAQMTVANGAAARVTLTPN